MAAKHPVLVHIGERIRSIREASGFVQDEFAAHIGIDRGYYGHLERGTYNLTVMMLLKIAAGLGMEAAALIDPETDRLFAQSKIYRPVSRKTAKSRAATRR